MRADFMELAAAGGVEASPHNPKSDPNPNPNPGPNPGPGYKAAEAEAVLEGLAEAAPDL